MYTYLITICQGYLNMQYTENNYLKKKLKRSRKFIYPEDLQS